MSSSSFWTIILPSILLIVTLELITFLRSLPMYTTPTLLVGSLCIGQSTKKVFLWPLSMKELYQEWLTPQVPRHTFSTNNRYILQRPTCSTTTDKCLCHIIQPCPITNTTWFPVALLFSSRASLYHSMLASPRVKLLNSSFRLLRARKCPTQSPLSLPHQFGNMAIPRCSNIVSTSSSHS